MIKVGIGEIKVARNPEVLSCNGLGSCVGICLYDPISKMGGLAHVLLPDSTRTRKGPIKPGKFADTAVDALVSKMKRQGSLKRNIRAKLVGGARMFTSSNSDQNGLFDMGNQNAKAAKKVLNSFGIRIVAEETGGDYGRSMEFNITTGKIKIKSMFGINEI